jgi:hypothetical protein
MSVAVRLLLEDDPPLEELFDVLWFESPDELLLDPELLLEPPDELLLDPELLLEPPDELLLEPELLFDLLEELVELLFELELLLPDFAFDSAI